MMEDRESELIMGFVKWSVKQSRRLDVYTEAEIAGFIEDYMKTLVAGS